MRRKPPPSSRTARATRTEVAPRSPTATRPAATPTSGTPSHGSRRGLTELGLERGDRVAVFLEKRLETVASIFGTSAAGGVFVPVNPLLSPQQVAYILADCDVRVLVTPPARSLCWRGAGACPTLEHVVVVGDDAAPEATRASPLHSWDDGGLARAGARAAGRAIDLDMAAILYTSGSTGKPKGVVLSHRNLIVGAESVSQYLGNTADDVILAALPLSFDAGFSQLTTAFTVGAHVVLMNYLLPRRRRAAVRAARGDRADLRAAAVDPDRRADVARRRPRGRLRYFANTGGRMPTADARQAARAVPERAALPDVRADRGVPVDLPRSGRGRPAPRLDRQGDPERRDPGRPPGRHAVRPGEEGELVHRGALVALGYWNDPERTAERFRPAPGHDAAWRTPELAVWSGDTVVRRRGGLPLLRRPRATT